jgi:hypothetical protein
MLKDLNVCKDEEEIFNINRTILFLLQLTPEKAIKVYFFISLRSWINFMIISNR